MKSCSTGATEKIDVITIGEQGDMFTYGAENHIMLKIKNKFVAIEAPYKINRMPDLIDCVIWTHNDPDHNSGLSTFLFRKLWDPTDDNRCSIVSLNTVVMDFWNANSKYMGINRQTGHFIPLEAYADVCTLHFSERRSISNVCGLEIESFKRSTIHGPFDTLAFKLLYKGKYILGYSGDTVADKELIDWLLEGGSHPVIHEVGSESPICHTTPDQLIELVPAEEVSRVYYNHLIGRSEKKLKDAGFRPVNELKVI